MGDPVVARLAVAARDGDWRAISDILSGVEHPDDHTFAVKATAFTDGVERWIDDWVVAEPRSTLPLLVKGAHAINLAWRARGGGRAESVGADAFRLFFKRLKLAENCLDEVTDRDRDSVTPWALLVLLGRARQVGQDETRRRFDEACRRYQWHLEAHDQMLQQLCRKWSGSHELMHEFAARTLVEMPAGSPLGRLTATAHLERWLDLEDGPDHEYISTAEVRGELLAAADRSVRHPDHVRRPGWPAAHNSFAMAFSLNGAWSAAAERFDVIGDLVAEWPWNYLGSPERAFREHRDRARAELGR